MAQVETKEVLIDYINTEIRRTRQDISNRLESDAKSLDERFNKLIMEELTHEEGFFGKEGSIVLDEGDQDEANDQPAADGTQEGQENVDGAQEEDA